MSLWARWFFAILLSLAAFGGSWWGLEFGAHVDSGTALGVAVVPFTIAITISGVWAGRERDREGDSVVATLRAGGTSWPDPSFIRGIEDYVGTLRRTWIKVGAPSEKEIERLTGGLVSSYKVHRLLKEYKYDSYSTFGRFGSDQEDFENSLIVLQAWGVPEYLMRRWKEAGPRALKDDPKQRRKRTNPNWFTQVSTATLFGSALAFFIGGSYPRLLVRTRLGNGNWFALIISSLILIYVIIAITSVIPSSNRIGKVATRTSWFALVLFSLASSLVAWYLAGRIVGVEHITHEFRNWLVWRF